MKKVPFILGILFLVLAAVVFVLADGLRRYYSGGFFTLLGVMTLVSSLRFTEAAGALPERTDADGAETTDST